MKQFVFIVFMLHISPCFAQLIVNDNLNYVELTQNYLVGSDAMVSNISFSGNPSSIGAFECINCNIELDAGIVMSSGNSMLMAGPNSESNASSSFDLIGNNDQDLIMLVNAMDEQEMNDWSILEFDFVALGDSLIFQFVWASEEYDTFAESQYKDVFGCFISGPGLSGPYSNNAINIAHVPGTNLPVGVSTINNGYGNDGPCMNCQFYNQIESDSHHQMFPLDDIYTDPNNISFNGYTDILSSGIVLQCGETYHVKLAICDVNDNILDSGVFIKMNTFSSSYAVFAEPSFYPGGIDGNVIYENCGSGSIILHRPEVSNLNEPFVAYIDYSGSALNGQDFIELPDSAWFDAGVETFELDLDILSDDISEGNELLHLDITTPATCGNANLQSSLDVVIADLAAPIAVIDEFVEVCPGLPVHLAPQVFGGYGSYDFEWSTADSLAVLDYYPQESDTLLVIVTDLCSIQADTGIFVISVLDVQPMQVSIVDSNGILPLDCSDSGLLTVDILGGMPPYSYSATAINAFASYDYNSTIFITPSQDGVVLYFTVQDGCGYQVTDTLDIPLADSLSVYMPDSVFLYCGNFLSVPVEIEGGNFYLPEVDYSWQLNGEEVLYQGQYVYSTLGSAPGLLSYTIADDCGRSASDTTVVILLPPDGLGPSELLNEECTQLFGCTNAEACNFDPAAIYLDSSCVFTIAPYEITGETIFNIVEIYAYTCTSVEEGNFTWMITGGEIISGQGTSSVEVIWTDTLLNMLQVQVENEQGCIGEIAQIDLEYSSVDEWGVTPEWSIQPSLVKTNFQLNVSRLSSNTRLYIFDPCGSLVKTIPVESCTSMINVHDFSAGVYLVVLSTNQENFQAKRMVILGH